MIVEFEVSVLVRDEPMGRCSNGLRIFAIADGGMTLRFGWRIDHCYERFALGV